MVTESTPTCWKCDSIVTKVITQVSHAHPRLLGAWRCRLWCPLEKPVNPTRHTTIAVDKTSSSRVKNDASTPTGARAWRAGRTPACMLQAQAPQDSSSPLNQRVPLSKASIYMCCVVGVNSNNHRGVRAFICVRIWPFATACCIFGRPHARASPPNRKIVSAIRHVSSKTILVCPHGVVY